MENLLPAEIITDIISRLPVESVLKCRTVCKTWRSLLHDPSFAHMHFRRSLHLDNDDDDQKYPNSSAAVASSKVGFIALIKSKEKGYQLYYGEYDDENDEQQSYKTLKKMNYPPLDHSFYIVGSCNGLICLSVRHHGVQDPVYICNPITREYANLPKLEDPLFKGHIVFGFGYHPRANVYKVVRIYYSNQPSVGRVQVYTLGDGNGWRNKGEIKYLLRFSPLSLGGVLANGALHWLHGNKGKIVSFDLADEEFRFLPSPPCYGGNYQLQVLGGLLCAVHQKEAACVNIWSLKKSSSSYNMMKDQVYYQSWSWSFEFSIEWESIYRTSFVVHFEPFALTRSGDVLLWYRDRVLTHYNRKTATIEKLVEYVTEWTFFEATLHMNSFVSLKDLGEDAKIIRSGERLIEPENN